MAVRKIQLPDGIVENVNDSRLHIYRTLTGTDAVTSSPYYCSRWDVTDDTVTAYEDGMVVWLEVPVAGNGSYGTCLQINSLGYKPIVYNVNSMISSRYSVGSMVLACYNATQTAKAYFNSGSATTVTGCWQVMDYDTNTTSISNLYHPRATRVVTGGQLKRYVMCVEADETGIIPLNYTGTTATTKTMTTEAFDPTREILYYTTNETVAENSSVALSGCFYSNTSVDARYTFNCGTTLTTNRELYMVLDVQSDGRLCKLASTPWSQTLPTTDDGHVYLLLGYAYDTYRIELYPHHPMFKHDGTSLKIWHGTVSGSGGSTTLDGLTDTTISSPTDGQVLTYDSTTTKWINKTPEKEIFWCTMTSTTENDVTTYTCDKTWAEIYAAYQAGKLPVLIYNDIKYFPYNIDSSYGGFQVGGNLTIGDINVFFSESFIYDEQGDSTPTGWSKHSFQTYDFSYSDKQKLTGIEEGAEVNVQSDWDESDSTSDAYIANKPTIPTVPTNVSSFTNDAGYLTTHDFTHTANTTISTSTATITFAANTRGSQMITVSADIGLTFAVNNLSDNYLWIANSGSAEIDVTVSAVTLNSSSVSNVYVPTDGITVPAGGVCELGIIANSDGAFITSRNDLAI